MTDGWHPSVRGNTGRDATSACHMDTLRDGSQAHSGEIVGEAGPFAQAGIWCLQLLGPQMWGSGAQIPGYLKLHSPADVPREAAQALTVPLCFYISMFKAFRAKKSP